MLSDRPSNAGILDTAKLARKLTSITPPTTLPVFAAGMIIATNIPYNATLNALTTETGITLPAATPIAVPIAQPGSAMAMAP